MTNVVKFPGETLLDLNPDDILDGAKGKLEKVMVIGYTEDGDEYFDSSFADGMIAVWLMERIKLLLLNIADGDEDDE
jgi:hypothetical protein